MMFVIEDEFHAETQDFKTLQEAMLELRRRAKIAWDEEPNRPPCQSWRTCGRRYVLIEYNDAFSPWREISRKKMLEVSATGIIWFDGGP